MILYRRVNTLLPLFAILTFIATSTIAAPRTAPIHYDIKAQDLATALSEFGIVSSIQIMFTSKLVAGLATLGVEGHYTLEQALDQLLHGSNLHYQIIRKRALVLHKHNPIIAEDTQMGSSDTHNATNESSMIEEIVIISRQYEKNGRHYITANKRQQNSQHTAISLTSIAAKDIQQLGITNTTDYIRSIPGVNVLETEPDKNQLVIRGVGISFLENSTVNSYFAEAPLTIAAINRNIDLKLVDLERIEVLRGPMGTLYGGGAMGGIVRYIPKEPDLHQLEGNIELAYTDTSHSNATGYHTVGIINIPVINNQMAVRVAAYHYDNAGYKDLVSDAALERLLATAGLAPAVEDDVNSSTYNGGRIALGWQINDQFYLSSLLVSQRSHFDDDNQINTAFTQSYTSYRPNTPNYHRYDQYRLASITMDYDINWATFSSISNLYNYETNRESALILSLLSPSPYLKSNERTKGYSQELRLTSELNDTLQFFSGLYYETLADTIFTEINLLALPNLLLFDVTTMLKRRVKQQAIFSEMEYTINPQWTLTAGGRWFHYQNHQTDSIHTSERGTVFKIHTGYQANHNTFVFARWSQGFRIGRGQAIPEQVTCDIGNNEKLSFTNVKLSSSIDSDTTTNYELGAKLTLLKNKASLNMTLYRIDWDDIPVWISHTPGICLSNIFTNSGDARIKGIEIETSYHLSNRLKLSFSASYNSSEFLNSTYCNLLQPCTKGERLPLTPAVNAHLAIHYHSNVNNYPFFFHTDYTYIGDFYANTTRRAPQSGGYGQWNIRTGIKINNTSFSLYVNNLTNQDPTVSLSPENIGWRLPPRVIGLKMAYQF